MAKYVELPDDVVKTERLVDTATGVETEEIVETEVMVARYVELPDVVVKTERLVDTPAGVEIVDTEVTVARYVELPDVVVKMERLVDTPPGDELAARFTRAAVPATLVVPVIELKYWQPVGVTLTPTQRESASQAAEQV